MKKIIILINLIILLSSCSVLNKIDETDTTDKNKELIKECWKNESLWINKTLKFKMCLPNDYIWYDAYWHNLGNINKKHNTFLIIDNKWKKINSDESIYNIWLPWGWYRNDWYFSEIYFNWCYSKKWKKYSLLNISVEDCFDSDTNEYKTTIFTFNYNKKINYISFNKNNKEHIKIIKSIRKIK